MSYTILGDISPWGKGSNHLQDDNKESSKTLCGKHLGFNYETLRGDDGNKLMIGLSKEKVLSIKYPLCKACIRVFNRQNQIYEHLEIHKS